MASRSAEVLEVDGYANGPNRHRSRSGGYTDFLEEQEKWERKERERAMTRYHNAHQRQPSDRLYVPTFDTTHRRVRSYDEINEKKEEPARSYKVREEKPRMSYDLSGEPAQVSELPVRQRRKPQQKKPSVKVDIIQDHAPPSTSAQQTPRKSPSASPRSPSAQPQLLFQFSTLQRRLAEIGTICAPNLHVEAANPRDLTFSKIADEVKGHAFQLRVWSYIVNLENMGRINITKRRNVELAARTLDRILERVSGLTEACAKAKPRDLKIGLVPETDDDDDEDDYADDESVEDVTESLGFIIQSHLHSIHLQIQTLSRMTRSLQEATPDAEAEVMAVGELVADVDRFFGSSDAIDRYSIDPRFAGRKALEEARYAAGLSR